MGPEEEYEFFNRENSWQRVFSKLHATDAVRRLEYSQNESKRTDNRCRNRYRDVVPYDHSRVELRRFGIGYINASLVQADEAKRAYILTQGPLADTSGHFWLMVWEQKSRAVLMLNRIIEKGQIKCHRYYPTGSENEGEDELTFDDVGLKVTYVEERESNANYTVRAFYLTDLASSESREVLQFHYTAWPDFGVPTSPGAFLDFLWSVRASGALDAAINGPAVIHCSAGVGRSGTFCLVDTCLVLVEKQGKTSNIRVLDTLMDMRRYRMGLVQTHDQLRFSYQVIIEGVRRIVRIPSRDSGYDNSIEDPVVRQRRQPPNVPMDVSSSEDDDGVNEFDDDDDDDESGDCSPPPPIPPRLARTFAPQLPPNRPMSAITRDGRHLGRKVNGMMNGDAASAAVSVAVSDAFIRDDDDVDDEDEEENFEENELVDGVAMNGVTRGSSRIQQPTDVRRRPRSERIKNPDEQIARMKRRQQDKELWLPVEAPAQKPEHRSMHLFILGATVVMLVTFSGYGLYRYYYR